MAARQEVTLVISARDRTRAVFRRIGRGIRRFRVGLGGLVAGGAFAALTKGALDFATSIEGASQRLGVAADTLQGLKILAEDLNIPFETLQGVIQRIGRNAGQALGGDTRLIDAFADLGITIQDLRRSSPEELFFKVADAANDTNRSWRETSAIIARIGDTEAVRLRGLLVQGGDALKEGVAALKAEGRIQGAEALKSAAETEAATRRELITAQKEFTDAMVQLLPVFTAALPAFSAAVHDLSRIVAEGRGSGGFGLGELAHDIEQSVLGRGFVAGTADDPAVKAAMLRIAAATEKTAADGGRLR